MNIHRLQMAPREQERHGACLAASAGFGRQVPCHLSSISMSQCELVGQPLALEACTFSDHGFWMSRNSGIFLGGGTLGTSVGAMVPRRCPRRT
jgi:hypothetical protein